MNITTSTEGKRFFNNFEYDFSTDVLNAFLSLVDYGFVYSQTKQEGDNLKLYIDNSSSYDRYLILKNCKMPSGTENCFFDFQGSTFTKCDDGYMIPAIAEDCEDDISTPIIFKFTGAELRTQVFDLTDQTLLFTEPFSVLSLWGTSIIDKYDISPSLLNEKELALLPLFKEIHYLDNAGLYTDDSESRKFPLIKAYAEKYKAPQITALLEKLETNKLKWKRALLLSNKIAFELNKADYEPLWREIYNKLVDSQKDYPKKSDVLLPQNDLKEIRSKIQRLMEQNGYTGAYPLFSKTTDFTGIRTADCHGEAITLFKEKNVKLYVQIIEEYTCDGAMLIQFLTGTALNKKSTDTTDAFSCLFRKRGVLFSNSIIYDYNDADYKSIEKTVFVALKKAELQSLTKEERKISNNETLVSIPLYIGMGIAFGALFTLLYAIFISLFIGVIDGYESAVDILKTAPWSYVFLASGGLFGIAMYIIALFVKRK